MAQIPRYNLRGKVPSDLYRQIDAIVQAVESMSNGNGATPAKSAGSGMLSDVQINAVTQKVVSQLASTGLLGAFAQTPLGTSTPDPLLSTINTGGTVTAVTAGDLSPLFTTTETASPTVDIQFSQINQNANIVFAGPASGVAAAPTFRSLVAADLAAFEASLLSSTTLNLNTNTKQTLYTVPAGKSALPLWVVGRSASTDLSAGATTNLSFGFNAGANDWANGTFGVPAFTSSSLFLMMDQTWGLAGSPSVIGTAGQTFGAIADIAFGSAATIIIEIFGYLI